MSDPPVTSKVVRHAAALLLLLCAASGCGRMQAHAAPEETALIRGEVGRIIRVDSEHGELNGVVGPEIIYDLYLTTPGVQPDNYQLWVTRDTLVYRQEGDGLRLVPFDTLRGGEQLEAHIGEVNRQGYRPGAYAVKLVILN